MAGVTQLTVALKRQQMSIWAAVRRMAGDTTFYLLCAMFKNERPGFFCVTRTTLIVNASKLHTGLRFVRIVAGDTGYRPLHQAMALIKLELGERVFMTGDTGPTAQIQIDVRWPCGHRGILRPVRMDGMAAGTGDLRDRMRIGADRSLGCVAVGAGGVLLCSGFVSELQYRTRCRGRRQMAGAITMTAGTAQGF